MLLFLSGIATLIVGYYTYGRLVEKIIGPDDRETPCKTMYDGVDYVRLPHWKNMLIQLLNIAGIGPVIGVILGIKFGAIAFLIIPIGNVFGGAVHDFLAGIMSIRSGGSNLPCIVRRQLGYASYVALTVFVVVILFLVVTVFINVPAQLMTGIMPFWYSVALIFLYYIVATLFPIDQIIGRIYPVFGLLLLLGTAAIGASLLLYEIVTPGQLLAESDAFKLGKLPDPIIPCLFVTIACGIMSGFHATQSPIVARTIETERQARSTFYGMMVVEGIIAMVWAAGGLAIYNLYPELMTHKPTEVLLRITDYFLGHYVGSITVLAVIILAVTSGDTALRCCRLTLAEGFHIKQIRLSTRLLVCIPLILCIAALLGWSNKDAKTFNVLWNYFAWGNQILAVTTLLAGTVWLLRQRKCALIAIVPGAFMCFVVTSFILLTPMKKGDPLGFGLAPLIAYSIAGAFTVLAFALVVWHGYAKRVKDENDERVRDMNELEAGETDAMDTALRAEPDARRG